jgi:hypothetical protein
MRKQLMLLSVAVLLFGCMAWAGSKTLSGVVSDSKCAAKHATAGEASAKCVEGCVGGGEKYVLVSKGKVYQLDAQDKFKGLGGKAVKVTGEVTGDAITVASVQEASGK